MDESYWTYKPGSPTPSLDEAKAVGAVAGTTTQEQWQALSPGMRREIVRSTLRLAS